MSVRAKRKSRAKRSKQPPDLSSICGAFSDGLALVSVAHSVIAHNGNCGPEGTALRLGCEALERVIEQLDEADLQLAEFCEAAGAS